MIQTHIHNKIWNYCSIIKSKIGHHVNIANCCEIYKAKIGNHVRIGFGTFICEGVTIEDNVFIGPSVCFSNDKQIDGNLSKTIIKSGVKIGANATILPNIIIHENAIIGAGSVVTKNVPKNETWAGNPAKKLK